MSTTTSKPYQWLRKIPTDLFKLDEIPLMGFPPKFPWEKINQELATLFQIEDLKIEATELQWRSVEDLFSGIGSPHKFQSFTIAPLEGDLTWAIAESDVTQLMALLIAKKTKMPELVDQGFEEGFHHFIALEVIHAIKQAKFGPDLSPQLHREGTAPQEAALTTDISITLLGTTIMGRLFISPTLRKSIKNHYEKKGSEALYTSPLSEKLEVTIHLEAGSTSLTTNEWSNVSLGDFVLLDHCSLKPEGDKGRLLLTINGHPFFRAKISDGNIKLLEHPLYHEVNETMDTYIPEEDEDLDEFEDEEEEFDEEEDEEFEEDDELEEEEEEILEEEVKVEAKSVPQDQIKTAPAPQDIPLNIIVEVGRLQMTVKNLLDLQPGNLIELDVHPERGVDLVVNGSRIAQGELLQVGDTLGVRITKTD